MGTAEVKRLPERVYRIGEVAEMVAVEPYVLRYWETEFPTLRPAKSPHGQRLYRDSDVDAVLAIKRLLYEEGFTIAGARKQLQEQRTVAGPSPPPPASAEQTDEQETKARETLRAVRDELRALLTRLSRG